MRVWRAARAEHPAAVIRAVLVAANHHVTAFVHPDAKDAVHVAKVHVAVHVVLDVAVHVVLTVLVHAQHSVVIHVAVHVIVMDHHRHKHQLTALVIVPVDVRLGAEHRVITPVNPNVTRDVVLDVPDAATHVPMDVYVNADPNAHQVVWKHVRRIAVPSAKVIVRRVPDVLDVPVDVQNHVKKDVMTNVKADVAAHVRNVVEVNVKAAQDVPDAAVDVPDAMISVMDVPDVRIFVLEHVLHRVVVNVSTSAEISVWMAVISDVKILVAKHVIVLALVVVRMSVLVHRRVVQNM